MRLNVKITFEHQESREITRQNTARHSERKHGAEGQSCGVYFKPDADRNRVIGMGRTGEKGKTLADIQQEAANIDVAVQQDYRTVMANTMSAEDYAKLEEEGFHFEQLDPETAVTILDRIKAELARSGQYIAGYTDSLDMDTLSAALGSDTLANAVADSFSAADIPLTEENMQGIKQAWDMASRLETPSEDAYRYMVDNGMEPEIWDFYLSQSSGTAQRTDADQGDRTAGRPKFYEEDIQGYYVESAAGDTNADLQEQIDKVLIREGIAVNEESRQLAETLLRDGLPLTKENLVRLQELQSVDFPVTEETFAKAAATAVTEGKDPIHARLTHSGNLYERAVEILSRYQNEAVDIRDGQDITARRQLEEIRLRMTAEVNVKLLRSGFAIDTAPMEELVEALRKAEAEVAKSYFPEDAEAVSKYETYCSVNEVVRELPGLPAQVLGPFSMEEDGETLSSFHAEGKALQAEYEKAQESYETLMTAPRRDLGDSIRKAFVNVDEILTDLGLDCTETNRRAMRILGYNRMPLNAENIERVKAADAQVREVVKKLTPASTLQMIRDGINPLETDFAELEQYFDGRQETYEDTAESYSRFLYGLEQKKEITEQERQSYIGIYRMLHQIDISDGAAVGALVNTGAEIHFANLLSAVRSGKFKSMDVSVTEDFGITVDLIRKVESISDQIGKAFLEEAKEVMTKVSYTQEAEESYRRMELEQIRQAASVEEESVDMLLRGQIPRNAEDLLAAQALSDRRMNPFREWKEKKEQTMEHLLESMEDKEEFQKEYQEMITDMESEVQEKSLQQADNSVDVRSLKLLHKQLSVAGSMARREEYIFPMYIGEELAKVHLTLEQGGGEKGMVHIALDLPQDGHLEGQLHAENRKISGILVGNTEDAVMKLKKAADIFSDSVQKDTESDWEVTGLSVTDGQRTAGLHRGVSSVNREVPDGEEHYTEVDNTELYRIAKSFLKAVQK